MMAPASSGCGGCKAAVAARDIPLDAALGFYIVTCKERIDFECPLLEIGHTLLSSFYLQSLAHRSPPLRAHVTSRHRYLASHVPARMSTHLDISMLAGGPSGEPSARSGTRCNSAQEIFTSSVARNRRW
jgi:hypothetical protein